MILLFPQTNYRWGGFLPIPFYINVLNFFDLKKELYSLVEELYNQGYTLAQVLLELGESQKKNISIYYAKLKRLNKKKIQDGFFNVNEFENWIM